MRVKCFMGNDVMGTETYTPQIGDMHNQRTSKILNIIFIVDISGSMRYDHRIEAVNEAFTKMIPALREIQIDRMSEFELRISIMTFEQNARWLVTPTPIMEYNHEDIVCSEYVTYFSNAFKTLGKKLTREEFMAHTGKIAQPYIMFMTDGEPTKDDNYQPALDDLLGNPWFRVSQRFAVLIGSDAINSRAAKDAVAQFVTDPTEGIINAADAAAIVAEVQARTIRTIQIATKHGITSDTAGEEKGTPNDPAGVFGGGSNTDGPIWGPFEGGGSNTDDPFGFGDFDPNSFI